MVDGEVIKTKDKGEDNDDDDNDDSKKNEDGNGKDENDINDPKLSREPEQKMRTPSINRIKQELLDIKIV